MLKYLIILLDDTSASYCHYENKSKKHRLISLDDLKAGILYAMKENLMIQFIYPDYELPQEYKDAIHSIDHSKIVPYEYKGHGDVVVINSWKDFAACTFDKQTTYVIRTDKELFFNCQQLVKDALDKSIRINVVITNVETFTKEDFDKYKECLSSLSETIEQLYVSGASPQLNILTDRMLLDSMNNCNAGWENITLAPDGKFYVCPAFYLADDEEEFGLGKAKFNIGDLQNGLDIKNPQLYKLSHSPLCRNCDAYQCKRCVWLNRKTTYEVNTPSHEQCVVAHLERNASRELLLNIRKHGTFLPDKEIKGINYLDPFDIRREW
ncbi:MAG: CXXX repeat peptide maturase [Prevotella sp.]|nr:CXXX repeat peptide maturase [Prevotella sp.]